MSLQSGCSSGSDLVDRGGFHLEGAHLRSAFDQVADDIGDTVELFTLICVCMLFRLPKADSENAIGVFVGDQSNFVGNPGWLFRMVRIFSFTVRVRSLAFPVLLVT